MKTDLVKNAAGSALSVAFDTEEMAQVLEAASRKGGRQSGITKKKSFAPSGLGYGSGKCPRYWYHAFHGAWFDYDNTTARERANMDAGTAAGDRIAKLFKSAGLLNSAEFEVKYDDPPIFGYGDLAVTWQGEPMVGEVKTTKDESFQIRSAAMKPPGYQLIQLLIYMYVLQKEKGFFVTENKNSHELLILPVKMTDKNKKLVEDTLAWMRMVKKNSDEDKLPTRPFVKTSKECKGCPVRQTCWWSYDKGTQKRPAKDLRPGVIDLPILEVPK